MSPTDSIKLVFLAAIWGGSFIFLRVAVPEVGPLLTALLRVSLAGVALLGFATMTDVQMNWRHNAKSYALVGLFATSLPFSCFSFASLYLPAAYSALLNSTAPLFGALFSVLWLAERMTPRKLSGLALGVTGVDEATMARRVKRCVPSSPQSEGPPGFLHIRNASPAQCRASCRATSRLFLTRTPPPWSDPVASA
jgi:threonine/homoserine efflux transporter RhtA